MMKRLNNIFALRARDLIMACICACISLHAWALPLATDSRIKTFVYSENEVFRITVIYGYQASIEFGKGEEVETISMGSAYSWQITPVGRRVFIKSIEPSARTNMTLITNKRTYQFELVSRLEDEAADEEQAYVVRFYYPDMAFDQPRAPVTPSGLGETPTTPEALSAMGSTTITNAAPGGGKSEIVPGYNYHYTFTGPERVAPIKIFDDGKITYFQFANNNATIPYISTAGANGKEQQLTYSVKGDYVTVKTISDQFVLKLGKETVYVFNEKARGGTGAPSAASNPAASSDFPQVRR